MRQAFQLDLNRCTGCEACVLACTIENELDWGTSWRRVETFNASRHAAAPQFHLSLACNHCADAPCMHGCPALAYSRDESTGAVLLDPQRCIGCRYCTWVCPFDAPRFDPPSGVVGKCTFCTDRLHETSAPACVTACPTGALKHGELSELPGSTRTAGFPDTPIEPSIRFLPLRRAGSPLEPQAPPRPAIPRSRSRDADDGWGKLASEWPLLVFTATATALVAWFVSSLLTGTTPQPLAVLIVGLAGAGSSLLHLGRKSRAWRALLNLRRSWLSREIAAYSAFVGLAVASGLAAVGSAGAWLAGIAGMFCLYAIDRVYDATVRQRAFHVHSADTLLTGLFLIGVLSGSVPACLALGSLKLGLYAHRKSVLHRRGRDWRPAFSAARVGLGFVVPLLIWMVKADVAGDWLLGAVAAGELIDRAEFYLELVFVSPRRQAVEDLRRLIFEVA